MLNGNREDGMLIISYFGVGNASISPVFELSSHVSINCEIAPRWIGQSPKFVAIETRKLASRVVRGRNPRPEERYHRIVYTL